MGICSGCGCVGDLAKLVLIQRSESRHCGALLPFAIAGSIPPGQMCLWDAGLADPSAGTSPSVSFTAILGVALGVPLAAGAVLALGLLTTRAQRLRKLHAEFAELRSPGSGAATASTRPAAVSEWRPPLGPDAGGTEDPVPWGGCDPGHLHTGHARRHIGAVAGEVAGSPVHHGAPSVRTEVPCALPRQGTAAVDPQRLATTPASGRAMRADAASEV